MEKRCHGKDYKVLWKDMHTTCRESFGEAFSDLFQDKWWRPQTEEIDNSEGVLFWSCYTFPPQVTLGCTPWVAFPTQVHPAEFLGSWKAVDLLVSLVRWQWARHWAHCGLCVTQQECPEPLRVQEASAWIECPCYIRALYLIHKQFSCLSCLWGNPELSPVITVTGWQDAISELSLAFPCSPKTLAAVCPCWEMFYTWRSHS